MAHGASSSAHVHAVALEVASSRSLAWGWRQVGNDLSRHSRQECNLQRDKKIARGERQGLHPEGARRLRIRERREVQPAAVFGTSWATAENRQSKGTASLSVAMS